MARRVVISDIHFGDPQCSLSNKEVSKGLRSFLLNQSPIHELILSGDILDANISSFSNALFGTTAKGKHGRLIGFHQWLAQLFAGNKLTVGRIIYIPGNHDYKVWDLLATEKNFIKPLAEGTASSRKSSLLLEDVFEKPFLRGVAPEPVQKKFMVSYPDWEFAVKSKKVLVTHGHYLDIKQTMFKTIVQILREEKGDIRRARLKFFQRTAQYQAGANAVSYRQKVRRFVDRAHKKAAKLFDLLDIRGSLRDAKIDKKQLRAIEEYLHYYRGKKPDIFIFGHTHEPASCRTSSFGRSEKMRLIKKDISVWNTGSFLKKKHRAGTFMLIDDNALPGHEIRLFAVDLRGSVRELSSAC